MTSLTWIRSLALVGTLVSAVAAADPIYVSVGQTKLLNLSRNVSRANAEDGSLLTVKRQGDRSVALTGKVPGKTEVRLHVSGGEMIVTEVHVVSVGATVYAASRDESNKLRARVVADVAQPKVAPATATVPATSTSSSASAGL